MVLNKYIKTYKMAKLIDPDSLQKETSNRSGRREIIDKLQRLIELEESLLYIENLLLNKKDER